MEEDLKLTLGEHLQELRSRLWKIVLAVLVLGGLALNWARDVFALLMAPVLAALPEESRALVYTSGIEEINVLLKVGLYAGIFLAAPIALYQLWSFVAPGLLPEERRFVGPFVGFGTLFFVGGALFCYLFVLPTMFGFLLKPGETGAVRERLELAIRRADDATRLLAIGEPQRASLLSEKLSGELDAAGSGRIPLPAVLTTSSVELNERLERLGRYADRLSHRAGDPASRKALAEALELKDEAARLLAEGDPQKAALRVEDAAALLARVTGPDAEAAGKVWSAARHVSAAVTQLKQEEWTRPMLSMKEQLSLVLMLEIAFGFIFELPLIMALLAAVGILRFAFIGKYQRHAILLCVAAAAILTPTGDVINLGRMAVPMVVCFELGVLMVWIFDRRRARAEQEADQADADPAV